MGKSFQGQIIIVNFPKRFHGYQSVLLMYFLGPFCSLCIVLKTLHLSKLLFVNISLNTSHKYYNIFPTYGSIFSSFQYIFSIFFPNFFPLSNFHEFEYVNFTITYQSLFLLFPKTNPFSFTNSFFMLYSVLIFFFWQHLAFEYIGLFFIL